MINTAKEILNTAIESLEKFQNTDSSSVITLTVITAIIITTWKVISYLRKITESGGKNIAFVIRICKWFDKREIEIAPQNIEIIKPINRRLTNEQLERKKSLIFGLPSRVELNLPAIDLVALSPKIHATRESVIQSCKYLEKKQETSNILGLIGQKGQGKTLCLYDIAYHFNKIGYTVIRPLDTSVFLKDLSKELDIFLKRFKKSKQLLIIIDDLNFKNSQILQNFNSLCKQCKTNKTRINIVFTSSTDPLLSAINQIFHIQLTEFDEKEIINTLRSSPALIDIDDHKSHKDIFSEIGLGLHWKNYEDFISLLFSHYSSTESIGKIKSTLSSLSASEKNTLKIFSIFGVADTSIPLQLLEKCSINPNNIESIYSKGLIIGTGNNYKIRSPYCGLVINKFLNLNDTTDVYKEIDIFCTNVINLNNNFNVEFLRKVIHRLSKTNRVYQGQHNGLKIESKEISNLLYEKYRNDLDEKILHLPALEQALWIGTLSNLELGKSKVQNLISGFHTKIDILKSHPEAFVSIMGALFRLPANDKKKRENSEFVYYAEQNINKTINSIEKDHLYKKRFNEVIHSFCLAYLHFCKRASYIKELSYLISFIDEKEKNEIELDPINLLFYAKLKTKLFEAPRSNNVSFEDCNNAFLKAYQHANNNPNSISTILVDYVKFRQKHASEDKKSIHEYLVKAKEALNSYKISFGKKRHQAMLKELRRVEENYKN